MAKFTEKFSAVLSGDVYPTAFQPGDDCPAELLDIAQGEGVVAGKKPAKKAMKKAPENK